MPPAAPPPPPPPSSAGATAAAGAWRRSPRRTTPQTIADVVSLHRSLLLEHDYLVRREWVEGEIPRELRGTYFRNGPGLQAANRHTFDGDGMVLSLSFCDGAARFRNRFVRTPGFVAEQAAGRPLLRTAFTRGAPDGSPLFNPLDFKLKNVANTGVLCWPPGSGRLLALYESNLPHELDAATLETRGETSLGGQLATPLLGAHYRVCPGPAQLRRLAGWHAARGDGEAAAAAAAAATTTTGGSSSGDQQQQQQHEEQQGGGRTLVGFSFNTRPLRDAELVFYEFDERRGALRAPPVRHALPGVSVALVHDFAVTRDYYVAVVPSTGFDGREFLRYCAGRASIAECIRFDPSKPATVHLVPRPTGAAAGRAPMVVALDAPLFAFHHVNAFQVPAPEDHQGGSGSSDESKQQQPAGQQRRRRQRLVLDTAAWDTVSFSRSQHNLTPDYFSGGQRSQLRRLTFELDDGGDDEGSANGSANGSSSGGSSARLIGNARLFRRTAEFPSVAWDSHGAPHAFAYCTVDRVDDDVLWGPAQAIAKVALPTTSTSGSGSGGGGGGAACCGDDELAPDAATLDVWEAGERCIVGEPLFVPRPGAQAEDDGWVLAAVHDAAAGRGRFVILDARRLAAGPVATINLPHFLSAGLHGSFSRDLVTFGGAGGGEPEWREPRAVRPLQS